jgi:hypothetical protein
MAAELRTATADALATLIGRRSPHLHVPIAPDGRWFQGAIHINPPKLAEELTLATKLTTIYRGARERSRPESGGPTPSAGVKPANIGRAWLTARWPEGMAVAEVSRGSR